MQRGHGRWPAADKALWRHRLERASKRIGKLHDFDFDVMWRRWHLRPAVSYVTEVSGTVQQVHELRLNQDSDRARALFDLRDVTNELQGIAEAVLAMNEHLTAFERRAILS